ncbi:MAG: hypothetical protein Q4C44_01420 [bacterium]|nr:hypothetical protein [bacterium]
MYMNKLIKKQLILILFTVVLVGTLVVTTSFAVFEDTKSNAQDQKMAVGDLDITFTGGSAINITNLSPMTDTTAKSQTNNLYTFSIANTGTVPYKFTVKLENNPSYTSNLLPHKYIRYSLNNATVKFVSDDNGVIAEGTIGAGTTNNYSLRLWVADAETYKLPDSSLGQEIHLQINVDGKAGGTPSTTPVEADKLAKLIFNQYTVGDTLTTPGYAVSAGNEKVLASAEDDYGTSYYFRGDITNNYVAFAGLEWRIVRITGDGSIKLVLSDIVSFSTAFNDFYSATDNGFIGLMYGDVGCSNACSMSGNCYSESYCDGIWTASASYSDAHQNVNKSTILEELEGWYDNNIAEYESYLADTIWCNDKKVVDDSGFNPLGISLDTDFGYGSLLSYYAGALRLYDAATILTDGPTLVCPNDSDGGTLSKYTVEDINYGNGALTKKIGMLTADEVAFAGGTFQSSPESSTFYLANTSADLAWITSTPFAFQNGTNSLFAIGREEGSISDAYVGLVPIGFRPAISLVSNIKATGTGTINDPYVIVGL